MDTETSITSATSTNAPGSVPRHLWSAPVAEAARPDHPPRLTRFVVLAPLVALVCAYLGATAAAHGHVNAGGWLLGASLTAILAGAVIVLAHAVRAARYRAETPR